MEEDIIEKSERMYDLNGRRINEIYGKGIYIIDGKKRII